MCRGAIALALIFAVACSHPKPAPGGAGSDGGGGKCPCSSGYACVSGTCQLAESIGCGAGFTLCAGPPQACADLTKDFAHCGACGNACAAGEQCIDSKCQSCGVGEPCCSNGACFAGLECSGGTCVCDATSCGSGCCDAQGCEAGTSSAACGTGGAACRDCAGQGCDWGACAPPPMPKYGWSPGAVADAEGRPYALDYYSGGSFGGAWNSAAWRLDPATNVWSTLTPPGPAIQLSATLGPGDRIYALTNPVPTTWSVTGPATLYIYDVATGQWTTGPALPTPRTGFALGTGADGRIYVAGGMACPSSSCGELSSAVEIFDPAAGTWSTGTPLPAGRYGALFTSAGGKLWLEGGYTGTPNVCKLQCPPGGTATQEIDALDLATGAWTSGPSAPAGSWTALVENGGRLYLFDNALTHWTVFDPAQSTWSAPQQGLPVAAWGGPPGVTGADGRVYFYGALSGTSQVPASFAFDPPTNHWWGPGAPGAPDGGAAGAWSTCLSPTAQYTTCDAYCATIGKLCSNGCTTPAGNDVNGAAAWQPGQACAGPNAGAAPCSFTWNDSVGAPPRWECCCQ